MAILYLHRFVEPSIRRVIVAPAAVDHLVSHVGFVLEEKRVEEAVGRQREGETNPCAASVDTFGGAVEALGVEGHWKRLVETNQDQRLLNQLDVASVALVELENLAVARPQAPRLRREQPDRVRLLRQTRRVAQDVQELRRDLVLGESPAVAGLHRNAVHLKRRSVVSRRQRDSRSRT